MMDAISLVAGEWSEAWFGISFESVSSPGKLGPEKNQLVNSEGGVNQRFGDFWVEILGSGRNRGGSFRALVEISRNREFPARAGSDVNHCRKGSKCKTPGGRGLDVGR